MRKIFLVIPLLMFSLISWAAPPGAGYSDVCHDIPADMQTNEQEGAISETEVALIRIDIEFITSLVWENEAFQPVYEFAAYKKPEVGWQG